MVRYLPLLALGVACTGPSPDDEIPSSEEPAVRAPLPDGYTAMYMQIADGEYDPLELTETPSLREAWVQIGVEQDFDAWYEESLLWFADEFGLDYDDPTMEGRLQIVEVATTAADAYRVVMSTWDEVPPEGLPVIDVAVYLLVVDPQGIELGGAWEGTVAGPGALVARGLYAIERPSGMLHVPFQSAAPGIASVTGITTAECNVEHPELGPGRAIVVGRGSQDPTTGRVTSLARNIFTFPR